MNQEWKPREIRRLNPGEMLFMEGDEGHEMFVVRSGMLKVLRREGSKMVELGCLLPGDLVGEMAVIGQSKRTATVMATELSQLGVISEDYLNECLPSFPTWIVGILKSLSLRLQNTLELKYKADLRGALPAVLQLMLASENSEGHMHLTLNHLAREVQVVYGLAEIDAKKMLRMLCPELFQIQGEYGHEHLRCSKGTQLREILKALEEHSSMDTEMKSLLDRVYAKLI